MGEMDKGLGGGGAPATFYRGSGSPWISTRQLPMFLVRGAINPQKDATDCTLDTIQAEHMLALSYSGMAPRKEGHVLRLHIVPGPILSISSQKSLRLREVKEVT